MGYIAYGTRGTRIVFGDRALAHLQIVMTAKLAKGESFSFSWVTPAQAGAERSTIWLHPQVTLRFRFAGSRSPAINETWLAHLAELADSDASLSCIPEPAITGTARSNGVQVRATFPALSGHLSRKVSYSK